LKAGSFPLLLGGVTYFFSLKMSRLIIFLGPSASICTGIAIGWPLDYLILDSLTPRAFKEWYNDTVLETNKDNVRDKGKNKLGMEANLLNRIKTCLNWLMSTVLMRLVRLLLGIYIACFILEPKWQSFKSTCEGQAPGLSHPQLMSQFSNGQIMDDYRESYRWLKEMTHEDARVMAWWDYGYQIAGMANRTTIADGNTWSQEVYIFGPCAARSTPNILTLLIRR